MYYCALYHFDFKINLLLFLLSAVIWVVVYLSTPILRMIIRILWLCIMHNWCVLLLFITVIGAIDFVILVIVVYSLWILSLIHLYHVFIFGDTHWCSHWDVIMRFFPSSSSNWLWLVRPFRISLHNLPLCSLAFKSFVISHFFIRFFLNVFQLRRLKILVLFLDRKK